MFHNHFFVLYALSGPLEISVVPLKFGEWEIGKSQCVR